MSNKNKSERGLYSLGGNSNNILSTMGEKEYQEQVRNPPRLLGVPFLTQSGEKGRWNKFNILNELFS